MWRNRNDFLNLFSKNTWIKMKNLKKEAKMLYGFLHNVRLCRNLFHGLLINLTNYSFKIKVYSLLITKDSDQLLNSNFFWSNRMNFIPIYNSRPFTSLLVPDTYSLRHFWSPMVTNLRTCTYSSTSKNIQWQSANVKYGNTHNYEIWDFIWFEILPEIWIFFMIGAY